MSRLDFYYKSSLIFIFFFLMNGQAQAQIVRLEAPVNTLLDISSHTAILIDESGLKSFDEIRDADFRQMEKIHLFINEGFRNYDITHWLKFRLSNTNFDQDFPLLFTCGWFDKIELYTIDARGKVEKQIAGLRTNLAARPYETNPYFFPLSLPANEELQVFVKINNIYRKNDVLLEPKLFNPGFAPLYLSERSQSLKSIYWFNAAFLGAVFFMFGLFLFQYFQNGDKAYFFYSGYLIGFFLYFLNRFEMYADVNLLFAKAGQYFYGWETTFSMFSYIMYWQFSRVFLDMKNTLPRLDKWLKYMSYTIVGYILVDVLISYILEDASLTNLLYYVVRTFIIIPISFYILFSAFKLIRKNKLALYFNIGSLCLMLGAIFAMVSSGQFETYSTHLWDRPMTYMQIGTFLELLFFALGLGYKTYQSQKEKQATQKRLISQLEKNERLQRQLNEELEAEVNTRTAEILEKSKQLEQQQAERLTAEYNQQLAEVELKSLQGQMNPHFLFNSLNSIKHFILTNDKFVAADYLTNFSKLVRLILNNSKQQTISLQEELETLKLYLKMEQMRFPKKFNFKITLGKGIKPEEIEIPPLILQPYVENAIWHGLMHKRDAGSGLIKIEVHQLDATLYFAIEDNGIGREKAEQIKSKSAANRKSYGMQITHARLTMTDQNAVVEIIDLKNESGKASGTRVELKLPYSDLV